MDYQVQKIVNRRFRGKQTQYLVKWKGYSSKDNTWEPVENFKQCPQMIYEFESTFKAKNNKNPSAKDLSMKQQKRKKDAKKRRQPKQHLKKSKSKPFFNEQKVISVSSEGSNSKQDQFLQSAIANTSSRNFLSDHSRRLIQAEPKKTNFTIDISAMKPERDWVQIKQKNLKVQGIFKDEHAKLGFNIRSQSGRKEIVSRDEIVDRNVLALLAFYELHLNFQNQSSSFMT